MVKIEPRTLKGFRDYGPKEQLARQQMFAKIQSVFERFGFLPLSTPVLEYKDILMGKYGEEGDRLLYSFKDNGDRDVAMRYDLTVPMARFVAQNQNKLAYPFKRYQIAPVWRGENTQKGRLREFYQCDIDIVGTESRTADAEVMACICLALEALGVTNYELRINDRRIFSIFTGADQAEIIRAVDKLDKVGREGVLEELRNKGMSQDIMEKVEWFLNLAEGDPGKLGEQMMEGQLKVVWDSMFALQSNLKTMGVEWANIKFSPTTARGLDYYTSTVFEIVLKNAPEFGSVAGGGRYDGLVDTFSDKSLPAVGGSIGIDRLFAALESMNLIQSVPAIKALVVNQDESLQDDYLAFVTSLRRKGVNAELYYEAVKLDKQFKYADFKGIPFAVIMGQDEKNKGVVLVKNLETREQEEVSIDALTSYLTKA